MALRYLRARRKQTMMSVVTAISILGVTVGVMALIISLALMSGFQTDIKAKILGSNAHLLVFPWASTELTDPASVVAKVEAVEGVVAAAPVIYQRGMAINEATQSEAPLLVKGIDPAQEPDVTDIGRIMLVGSLEELEGPVPTGPAPMIMGEELARELDVLPGDEVRVVALHAVTGPGGLALAHPANRRFRVTGIFQTGMWDYDSQWAYVGLPVAQQFFRMGETVSLVEARLAHPDDTATVTPRVADALGERYRVQSWDQMNRAFFSALQIEKLLLFLVISLIGVVASLNIATTLVMSVMEKGRDIAILMAMGARRASITRIFRFQGLIIGGIGTILGIGLGIATCAVIDHYQLIRLDPEVYYITHVPFRVEPLDVLAVAALALGVSFVATLYPARHASRVSPCEGLRYE